MNTRTSRRARLRALTAMASLAAAVAATVSAPSALAAPNPALASCPDAYPVADLASGQPVTGLTVSSGNTPDQFTGNVLGVLSDGIAPGIDMIIVKLSSDAIDNAGIWAGMSGSPVYAADGRLIGAVSYGLTYESSPVAGVTPAADMQALLGGGSSATTTTAANPSHVVLPQRMQQRLVADGLATPSEAQQGLTRLPLPLGVSGSVSTNRLNKAASRLNAPSLLGRSDVLLYKTGAAPASTSGTDAIFPGSNLAASISYGDLTSAGIGTTTMVCNGQVVGFGHPFNFTGASTMTMHGANVITVLKDDIGGSYKLANLTGPVGEITGDHFTGISGPLGKLPVTTLVDSKVTLVSTGKSRTGDTYVSLPDYLPDMTLFAQLDNQDVVFDQIGKGSSLVHFTIDGTADGEPFTAVRTNRFASPYDISFESVFEAANDVSRLLNNRFAHVQITAIRITTQISPDDRQFTVAKVQRLVGAHYVTLTGRSVLRGRPGHTVTLRVTLTSPHNQFGSKVETLHIKVPNGRVGSFGQLVVGRNTAGGGSATSFNDLLTKLANAPRNDQLSGEIDVFSGMSERHHSTTKAVSDVVGGFKSYRFLIKR